MEAGQTVTVTLGGQTYTTTVGADGSWSLSVPSAALTALAAGTTTLNVTVSNAAGTAASASR
nr:Ig-like domain-containing protein [Pantoea ananatis]